MQRTRELEDQTREFFAQIGELKERMETVVGRLPVAPATPNDHAQQTPDTTKDTAQKRGGSDWLLIAKGRRPGRGFKGARCG
jgi:hypothetical protein